MRSRVIAYVLSVPRKRRCLAARSIDGSSMAITLVNSCLHTSTVTAPEFEMSPPTFLEKCHLCLPVAKRYDR